MAGRRAHRSGRIAACAAMTGAGDKCVAPCGETENSPGEGIPLEVSLAPCSLVKGARLAIEACSMYMDEEHSGTRRPRHGH